MKKFGLILLVIVSLVLTQSCSGDTGENRTFESGDGQISVTLSPVTNLHPGDRINFRISIVKEHQVHITSVRLQSKAWYQWMPVELLSRSYSWPSFIPSSDGGRDAVTVKTTIPGTATGTQELILTIGYTEAYYEPKGGAYSSISNSKTVYCSLDLPSNPESQILPQPGIGVTMDLGLGTSLIANKYVLAENKIYIKLTEDRTNTRKGITPGNIDFHLMDKEGMEANPLIETGNGVDNNMAYPAYHMVYKETVSEYWIGFDINGLGQHLFLYYSHNMDQNWSDINQGFIYLGEVEHSS